MKVGLTGGMGCGKSAVLAFFRNAGWETYDADTICRDVTTDSFQLINEEVHARWNIFYDPKAIAKIIFSRPEERIWFTKLLHPMIKSRLEKYLRDASGNIMIEVPLLFETEWEGKFDRTLAVWTDFQTASERIRTTRGWSLSEIKARCNSQLSAAEKLRRADYGLINQGTPEFLNIQCRAWLEKIEC